MIKYKLVIDTDYSSEILERIFRIVRHRKFEIYKITMNRELEENVNNVIIKLKISSKYPINLLCNQLKKIIYINNIDIKKLD